MTDHPLWRGWAPLEKQPRPRRQLLLRQRRRVEQTVRQCPQISWTMASLLTPRLQARRRPTGVALARRWIQRHLPRLRSPSRTLGIVLTHQAVPARHVGPVETLAALHAALLGGRRHHPRSDLRPAGLKVQKQLRNSTSREPLLAPTKLGLAFTRRTDVRTKADRQTGPEKSKSERRTSVQTAKTLGGDGSEEGGRKTPFLRSASGRAHRHSASDERRRKEKVEQCEVYRQNEVIPAKAA
jgi:hypothetical protein